ncbi:hypothetical protein EON66_10180 [archaeon]|nr:MAG: hypothetical protein EON66_10180 [archaeon]
MTTAVAATKKTGVHASPAAVAAGGADAASGGGEHTVRRPRKPTFVNPEASGPSRWYESTPEVSNLLDDANITLSKLTTVHEVLVRDKSSVLAMERRIVHSLRELSQVSHLRMEAEKRVAHARKVSEAHAKGEGADGASVVEIPPLPPTVIETLANGREGVLEASPRSVRLPPAPATIAQTAGAIAADAMCGHKESTRASGRGLPAALICDADTPLGIALLSPMTTLRPPRSPATKVSDWQERRSPGPASSTLLRSPSAVHNMDSMFRSSPSAVSAARSLFR